MINIKTPAARLSLWLLFLVLPATGRMVRAAETTIVQAPARIPRSETRQFELGKIEAAGTVLLKISSRLDSKGLSGSSFFMKLRLNGQEVRSAKRRLAVRLVNRPMNSPISIGVTGPWFGDSGGWRVIYAPDFEKALAQTYYSANPYVVVLDVTDLVKPDASNLLEITNTATQRSSDYAGTAGELVIGELSVSTTNASSPLAAIAADPAPIVNRGEPAAGPSTYSGQLLPGGGFSITMGHRTYRFNSAFSYPHDGSQANAGFNHFDTASQKSAVDNAVVDTTSNQPGWKVHVPTQNGAAMESRLSATGPDYRVERTIRFEKQRVAIADAITNLHRDAPLGLEVRHEMVLSGLGEPEIRLAGNTDPTINDYYAPGNPSVHIRLPQSGIGLIAQDDVLRNQARLYANPARGDVPAVAGLHTNMLRLSPGETYTLHWAVYPVAGPDYYDFINQVRRDWKTNFTVPGAWWWGFLPDTVLEMPLPQLREFLLKNGIRYANFDGGWLDRKLEKTRIGFGVGVFDDYWADYRRRIRAAAEKLHQALPAQNAMPAQGAQRGITVLGYYDIQQDTSENSPQKFADSWLTTPGGQQVSALWEGPNIETTRFYGVVPTLHNSFGKAALTAAERYMDEMKLDGLYWDEMENITYGIPRLTYNLFDSHTCLLDSRTGTIEREIGLAPLVSAPFRRAVIEAIQKRGGTTLGNTPSGLLSEAQTGVMRMVEIQNHEANTYQAQLGTPLGYIGTHNTWADFRRALNFAMLPVVIMPREKAGDRVFYKSLDHDILPYLFPFTPIELHAGYLLGRERIIVTHDGRYGWPGEPALSRTRHFDKTGKLTTKAFPIHCTIGKPGTKGESRTAIQLAPDEAAVLEKIPATLTPLGKPKNGKAKNENSPAWEATATVARYDHTALELELRAPQAATLTLRPGALPLNPGSRLKAILTPKTGPSITQSLTVRNATVTLTIPAGFEGTCKIEV